MVLEGVLEIIEVNLTSAGVRFDLLKEAAAIAVASRAMSGSGLGRAVDQWLAQGSLPDFVYTPRSPLLRQVSPRVRGSWRRAADIPGRSRTPPTRSAMNRSARSLRWGSRRRTTRSDTRHGAILRVGHHRTDQRRRRSPTSSPALDKKTMLDSTLRDASTASLQVELPIPVSFPVPPRGLTRKPLRRRPPMLVLQPATVLC